MSGVAKRLKRLPTLWKVDSSNPTRVPVESGFIRSGKVRGKSVFFTEARESQRKSGNVRDSPWKLEIVRGK